MQAKLNQLITIIFISVVSSTALVSGIILGIPSIRESLRGTPGEEGSPYEPDYELIHEGTIWELENIEEEEFTWAFTTKSQIWLIHWWVSSENLEGSLFIVTVYDLDNNVIGNIGTDSKYAADSLYVFGDGIYNIGVFILNYDDVFIGIYEIKTVRERARTS